MADEALLPVETGADEFELETPELETPEVEETEVEGEEPEGDGTEETETEETQEQRDGRQTPDAVRKALKSLRESHPAEAKLLNDSFGREQAYKAVFPKVADAQAAHAAIQSFEPYGGIEGVQTTLSEVEEIDAQLAAGDPACLDRLQEIAGDGLGKLVPEILTRMRSGSAEQQAAYTEMLAPIVAESVANSGMTQTIQQIWNALVNSRRTDAPESFKKEAQEEADALIRELFKFTKDLGTAKPATSKANPADAQLSARERAVQEKENVAFDREVGNITDPGFQQGLNKELNPYLDKLKLVQSQKEALISGIWQEITKLCSADKVYLKNLNAAKTAKNRSPEKVAAIVNAKFSATVGQATKTVVTRLYPQGAKSVTKPAVKGAKAAPAAAQQAGKPILVKEFPERSQIDFAKTTEDMIARGIRVLKNGRVVKLAS